MESLSPCLYHQTLLFSQGMIIAIIGFCMYSRTSAY